MATLNSMRTLDSALKAIRQQNYPQHLIEILVVDGGSTDGTRELAKQHGCQVLDNPRVEPVSAKLIGFKAATGDYLMHVDSDEVLVSQNALSKRARAFQENPNIKMVFAAGYQNPKGIPFAARYINEFGDPFSMFYYRLSKDARFFVTQMRGLVQVLSECEDYVVFKLGQGPQPILENAACGNCIDLKFFRAHFGEISEKPWGPVHFFYHMQQYSKEFAITKDDAILHYSADHWSSFTSKITWRIRNNIFFLEGLGSSGFSGREHFDPLLTRLKKYLYLPYAFLIIPAVLDALYLMWSRRDWQYWQHLPLTLYTATMIVGMATLKILGYRPQLKSYGEQKTVSSVAGPSQ